MHLDKNASALASGGLVSHITHSPTLPTAGLCR